MDLDGFDTHEKHEEEKGRSLRERALQVADRVLGLASPLGYRGLRP